MAHRTPRQLPQLAGDPSDPQGFAAVSSAFFGWMAAKNYSLKTIDHRRFCLAWFFAWCEERGVTSPSEVTRAMLERYQRWLFHYRKADGSPLTFASQRTRVDPLRAFFKWCARNRCTLYNPAGELEMPRREIRLPRHILSAAEAEKILCQAGAGAGTPAPAGAGLRDRAMLEVIYSTGMRRGELAGLMVQNVDFERGTVMIRQGKGMKDRMVPIGERALAWVQKYLDEARPSLLGAYDAGTLFLDSEGAAFEPERLTRLVGRYVEAAQLGKTGSCHLFRHTMATLMLENGADIRFIQAMLGHVQLSTTQIYTQVSIRKLKEIHTLTHPARLKKAVPDALEDPGEEKS